MLVACKSCGLTIEVSAEGLASDKHISCPECSQTLLPAAKPPSGEFPATKADSIRYMFHVEVARPENQPQARGVTTSSAKSDGTTHRQVQRVGDKIGRNEACPCGSGKKYKRCHGAPGAEPLPESV